MYCLLPPSDAKPARPAPAAVCDESEYFFGAAHNTEIISHDFILLNEGLSPLHISAVRTDCGCVLARLADDTLDPGESVALNVKFDLKRRSGQQIRRIIVESNDPDQPRFVLTLAGEALAPLEIAPDRIYWGNIHTAAAVEKSCEIRFSEGDESYINSVLSPDPSFAAELISIKPRRLYKVVVRTVPPLRPGKFETNVRLETDHPRFKTIEIPMQGRVVGYIYAIPDEINVESKDGRPVSRTVLVYSGVKTRFNIVRVEPPSPEIETSIRKMSLGQGYRIDLRNINPSRELDGKTLVITTDCGQMPTISVPLKTSP